MINFNYKIILASQSPRRQELLKNLNLSFETTQLNIDESYPPHLVKNEITEYLVKKKSLGYGKVDENSVIITADTIVWNKDHSLEKPKDLKKAKNMLLELSNSNHTVYTSVGFTTLNEFKVLTDSAKVYFSEISKEEINFYLEKQPPLDKAGAYGIQDWIGLTKIDRIEGSYFTIMGLPTHLVYGYLKNLK